MGHIEALVGLALAFFLGYFVPEKWTIVIGLALVAIGSMIMDVTRTDSGYDRGMPGDATIHEKAGYCLALAIFVGLGWFVANRGPAIFQHH